MSGLLSVDLALARILDGVERLDAEIVPLKDCIGRVLAAPVAARRPQPPFAASAMDGYAVRVGDLPGDLLVVGESAAGHRFEGDIAEGEAVRIFTGAPLPASADAIVIQEDVEREGDRVRVKQAVPAGTYVRRAGLDFEEGQQLLQPGAMMDAGAVSLAAAANCSAVPLVRRPVVALIATGDELVPTGTEPGQDQIVASNIYGLSAHILAAGGTPYDCGIARDNLPSMQAAFELAGDADIVVTLGGASVGDHDLVRAALEERGVDLAFWKLAMQPGKPVIFGTTADGQRYLGLPGNPVSGLVCSQVFLMPLIRAMLGDTNPMPVLDGVLGCDLPASGSRRQFMRAGVEIKTGRPVVTPFERQDSSLLRLYATSNCLLIRPENSAAAPAGSPCRYIMNA